MIGVELVRRYRDNGNSFNPTPLRCNAYTPATCRKEAQPDRPSSRHFLLSELPATCREIQPFSCQTPALYLFLTVNTRKVYVTRKWARGGMVKERNFTR